jgi:hypothetical protein
MTFIRRSFKVQSAAFSALTETGRFERQSCRQGKVPLGSFDGVTYGRPDMARTVGARAAEGITPAETGKERTLSADAKHLPGCQSNAGAAGVVCCGPEPLMHSVQREAVARGMDLHMEEFGY